MPPVIPGGNWLGNGNYPGGNYLGAIIPCRRQKIIKIMWCVARFGTICAILKMWKHPWRSVTFSKSNTPPWVFFVFLTLYKWYQIAQSITINLAKYYEEKKTFQINKRGVKKDEIRKKSFCKRFVQNTCCYWDIFSCY